LRVTIATKARRINARGEEMLDAEFVFGVVLELVGVLVEVEEVLVDGEAGWISKHSFEQKRYTDWSSW
jgi:hypothetical protein